jgi:hypothetical protein
VADRVTAGEGTDGEAGNVMLAVAAARPARVSRLWLVAAVGCVLLIGVLGFWAGQALAGGGLLDLDGESATIAPGAGGPVTVRVTPQTRLPQRRPRVGDGVLVVGQPQADGTWVARAVLLRRAGR